MLLKKKKKRENRTAQKGGSRKGEAPDPWSEIGVILGARDDGLASRDGRVGLKDIWLGGLERTRGARSSIWRSGGCSSCVRGTVGGELAGSSRK
ncbi:hypothetical protein ACLOJK_013553 [Asimina triloba]